MPNATGQHHTVAGEMWDKIAFVEYGSETLMQVLIHANPLYNQTVVFDAGVVLNVPQVSATTQLPAPPWKTIVQL